MMRSMTRRNWIYGLFGVSVVTAFPACHWGNRQNQEDESVPDSTPDDETRTEISKNIQEASDGVRNESIIPVRTSCVECGRCMPCVHGVDIPANLGFINATLLEGSLPSSKSDGKAASFLAQYDRRLFAAARADRCIHCNACGPRGPLNIDIPAELGIIAKYIAMLRA